MKQDKGGRQEEQFIDRTYPEFRLVRPRLVWVGVEIEGKDFHQRGNEARIGGRIAQVRHGMLEHLLSLRGIAFLEEVEAEGADGVGRVAFALGQLPGQMGGLHRLLCGKTFKPGQVVEHRQPDKGEDNTKPQQDGRALPFFHRANELLDLLCEPVLALESLQMVRVKFAVQRAAAHPQFFGGEGPAAFGLFERANDQLLLGLGDRQVRLVQQAGRVGRDDARAQRRGQIAQADPLAAGQNHRVFDGGAQFAHVAGP